MTPLTIPQALAATFVSAAVIFSTRAFPFVLFSHRKPPHILAFVERSIPPMVMAILVVNCFCDARCDAKTASQAISLGAVVLLHLWKKNPMISIFGGTVLYMALLRLWH